MLNETSLAAVHRLMGGKMVDFGGWSMPVNYGSQIEEHNAVRSDAGMFDVSHMTIIDVAGEQAQSFLQRLLANDVAKLKTPGKALYSAMLNERGGVIDDLIVYLTSFGYRLVVNCGTREKDLAWIAKHAQGFSVSIEERPDLAIIAVQGPNARDKVHALLAADERAMTEALAVFSGAFLAAERSDWLVARTGYTGEDGYEIMLPADEATVLWQSLADAGVRPCGLGARDTLRLEAGMNLYGHEMDEHVSPLVANMGWTVAITDDRDFIGADSLKRELAAGVKCKLVGLLMRTRGVLREGYVVQVPHSEQSGVVTSGTFSPTLGHSIALARVPEATAEHAQVIVRGKAIDVEVVRPCFVRHGAAVV